LNNQSRRQFLKRSGSVFGGSWLSLNLPLVLAAAQSACSNLEAGSPWQNLTTAEADGFTALVDQIIPPDESPGASEIGVVHFLDEALNNVFKAHDELLKKGLSDLESRTRARFGASARFSLLAFDDQTGLLRDIDSTDMFKVMVEITQLGMFALPEYGGNKDHKGWELIGFEHQHVWQPPFGYYDGPDFSSDADNE
jgi:gluconate 2-dehydrogenase gamma chain